MLNQEHVRSDTHHLFVCFCSPSHSAEEVLSYTTTDGRSNIQYILKCLKCFDNVFEVIGCWVKPPSFLVPVRWHHSFTRRQIFVAPLLSRFGWNAADSFLIANLKRVCCLFCGDENLSNRFRIWKSIIRPQNICPGLFCSCSLISRSM